MMKQNRNRFLEDITHLGRGFLMGGADIIPGVSGGTVALILGVYQRLITALSRFDLELLRHLRAGQWSQAAGHIDLRFLVALGCGILCGVGGLASLMHFLLEQYAVPTWSLLFGLILASSYLVAVMVPRWNFTSVVLLVLGALFAYWLVGQFPVVSPGGYLYLFLCGCIAICAMILPGISGAFLLVILGMYFHVTGVIHSLQHGDITRENLMTLVVFACGCAVGLLSFSKLLKWLLNRYESGTMAVLAGVMIGSLRKIWPFKSALTEDQLVAFDISPDQVEKLAQQRIGNNFVPELFSGETVLAIVLMLVGVALVLGLDWATSTTADTDTLAPAPQEQE